MTVAIPELALVALIGASGSGKSTFARRHFRATEIISSDYCRGLVSDDANDQAATHDAFEVLYMIAAKRLAAGRLTVIDATNVRFEDRGAIVKLSRQYHVLPVALVFDLPERICHDRNALRADRQFGEHVVRNQRQALRRSLRGLGREGFRHVHVFKSPEEMDQASIERTRLWNNRRDDHGPFDIIGDVHGCCDELEELLGRLGYEKSAASHPDAEPGLVAYSHPQGRKAIFVGDLVDRGPRVLDSLQLAMSMAANGSALCVPGNHDVKLLRKLRGKDVQLKHGLAMTMAEFDRLPPEQRPGVEAKVTAFIDGLVSHYMLDDGKLVVAHAGMKQAMQGRASGAVREFALYGETTGETDEFGLPVRYNWAMDYRGQARVVYGHTPVPEPQWLNRTINLDTGCVFGGSLTALRYPELELVSVPARRTYCEPARPILATHAVALTDQQMNDDMLDLEDVHGKRVIETRLMRNVTVREANAAAALEVMSRFAIDPRWLIYLPPTMSPVETSQADGLLEHPAEAFSYYRQVGVPSVMCEEKHMGSRAVVIVCRDAEVARQRFGVPDELTGICYTRTGRRFFSEAALEQVLVQRVIAAASASGLWETLETDWLCLDCELMPWSAKAQALLREQYAAVGAAASGAFPATIAELQAATNRCTAAASLLGRFQARQAAARQFVESYRRYCWDVAGIDDYRLAPFHLLASERAVHAEKPHDWHMSTLASLCASDPQLLLATPHRVVDVNDEAAVAGAIQWWTDLTEHGGEGMVVKPLSFVATNQRGLIQPAVKCRGREYLRIIYGPDYTHDEHLTRLRDRGLSGKRSLALREFALGIEGLERFVRCEPLRRVHECVFGVLAMESEPIDPRL